MDRRRALEILGLSESASLEDVRRRFRELALRYHPDVGGDRGQMQLISRAYATLVSSYVEPPRIEEKLSPQSIRKMLAFLGSLPLHPRMAAELRRIGLSAMWGGSERSKVIRWFGVLARAWRSSEGMEESIRRMLIVRLSNMLVSGDVSDEEIALVSSAYNVAAALMRYLEEVGSSGSADGIRLPAMVGGVIAGMLRGFRGSLLALLEPRTSIGAEQLWQQVDSIRRAVVSTLEFAGKVSELYSWLDGLPFGGRWRREMDGQVMKLAATDQSIDGILRLMRAVQIVRRIQGIGRELSSALWRLGADARTLEWASAYSRLTAVADWGVERVLAEGDRLVSRLKERLRGLELVKEALGRARALELMLEPYSPGLSGKVVARVWERWLSDDIEGFARMLAWAEDFARRHIADADISDVIDDLLEKVIG